VKKKYGLCLSGGGGRGAYQIGVAQALDELGIFDKIEVFAGTSIGAANMAVLISKGLQQAKDVWFNMPEDNMPRNNHSEEGKKSKRIDLNRGIYSMDRFSEILSQNIDFSRLKEKEAYVTVADCGDPGQSFFQIFKSSYQHYITKDPKAIYMPIHQLSEDVVLQSIIASCSIPILFPPVTVDSKKCYDGGVFDKVPLTPLIEAGCNEIIVVHLHRKRYTKPKNIPDSTKIHEIKRKNGYPGKVMKFDPEHTKNMYNWGYEDTMNYFNEKG